MTTQTRAPYTNILVDKHNAVTVISINRAKARNAVDGPTAASLAAAFRDFDSDESQKVAILTGVDGTFCAGADLKAVSTSNANPVTYPDGDGPMGPTRMLLSKPVIAAIEGFAVAGGLELAAWCDLRVAAEDAVFGVYCRRWGVPLIDGGTIRLTRLLGHSHAMDLILTGRGVSGQEAKQMGLANRLTASGEALQTAIKLAQELGNFPQQCMRSDRLSSYEQWDMSIPAALQHETSRGIEVIKSGETRAGAARFAAGKGRHGDFEEI
ncbi:MAG: crotonase/enoyl-CoA hydratase family protein [Pseudomonadales bacterium]|nr:crotonase/enoyl-CoA hydratase family protein [Pseudomonadales bacterium]